MSTPESEIKAAVTQEKTAVVAQATTVFSKVKPYLIQAGCIVVGWLIGHYL